MDKYKIFIERLEKFAEQCPDSQRGRPVANPQQAQKDGVSVCEKKRKADGKTIYYKTKNQREKEKNRIDDYRQARKKLGMSKYGKIGKDRKDSFLSEVKSIRKSLDFSKVDSLKDNNDSFKKLSQEHNELVKKYGELTKKYDEALKEISNLKSVKKETKEEPKKEPKEEPKKEPKKEIKKEAKEEPKKETKEYTINNITDGIKTGSEIKNTADAMESIHELYKRLKILQKYSAIKIPLLRKQLGTSQELFDKAIETLAAKKKIDLLQASNEKEDFDEGERKGAYFDSVEDQKFYYIQWAI